MDKMLNFFQVLKYMNNIKNVKIRNYRMQGRLETQI